MESQNELKKIESLLFNLPDITSGRNFVERLQAEKPNELVRLLKKDGLFSDILALVSASPLLATTILQNPHYISWIGKKRADSQVRTKEESLESLARFALTNSSNDTHVLLARFRRRELLRIYLRDLRGLVTISEITEELSNLADASLEFALRIARQQLDNRYGAPLQTDDKNRATVAKFCIVSLGKLGSRELNYASDIDLLFIYSSDGETSGTGTRSAVTNREYFVKLAELVSKIVGESAGEGAAYRVDLRLRPYGRVGALAISQKEAVRYYTSIAQSWERQVLLRSRASAGESEVFKCFWQNIEQEVYSTNISIKTALENVRLSKEKINQEHRHENGFNVKLGEGGIREIEFIAQALQLAYGGKDDWLRNSHTLISLSRLADRKLLNENELTMLSDAYKFLRKLEHRLQMENGLQTHAVPDEPYKRLFVARLLNFETIDEFDLRLKFHTENVSFVFNRVFSGEEDISKDDKPKKKTRGRKPKSKAKNEIEVSIAQTEKIEESADETKDAYESGKLIRSALLESVELADNFHDELAFLRGTWHEIYNEILQSDLAERITTQESQTRQNFLAEASIEAALLIAKNQVFRKYPESVENQIDDVNIAVLGLGKLGSAAPDFGSDLDLVMVFDDEKNSPIFNLTNQEFYAKTVEYFVTALSSLTREGSLYRVDLRLRPDGKNGATCIGKTRFLNYLRDRAEIWELLAYVKLRCVGGKLDFAAAAEREAREIIHQRAKKFDESELRNETRRVREMLEKTKTKDLRRGEIDIKYGSGGLLDIYFAVRYLQLRDDIRDADENRSTLDVLRGLRENKSIEMEVYEKFRSGYDFLKRIDHALRLFSGRSSRVPNSETQLLAKVAERLMLDSSQELLHLLNINRIFIQDAYHKIFSRN